MSRVKSVFVVAASTIVMTAFGAGCSVQTEDPQPTVVAAPTEPAAVASTLIVDWTVDGQANPDECVKDVVGNIEITVVDSNGISAGTFQQSCQTFSTSITLDAGSYSATAVLLDGANQPRTTTIDIRPFTLRGNDSLSIPIDFPASSFL